MLERVARNICGAQPHMLTMKQINAIAWQSEVDLGWTGCLVEARAAVQALMEPDEGMAEEAWFAMCEQGDGGPGDVNIMLSAMLRPLVEGEA